MAESRDTGARLDRAGAPRQPSPWKRQPRRRAIAAVSRPPTRYVAFLRAINVGGHVVKMDYLRRLFLAASFENVETFIASGNVVFEAARRSAADLEVAIQASLQRALGYRVATFVRSLAEVAEIAARRPFGDVEKTVAGARVFVAFVRHEAAQEAQRSLLARANDVDDFRVYGREVYWLCRKPFAESTFSAAALEKLFRTEATVRNSTTVRKIAAKYCE